MGRNLFLAIYADGFLASSPLTDPIGTYQMRRLPASSMAPRLRALYDARFDG